MVGMTCVSERAGESRSMMMGQKALAGPSVGIGVVG